MTSGQMFVVCTLCFFVGVWCCALIFIKLDDNRDKMIERLKEVVRK